MVRIGGEDATVTGSGSSWVAQKQLGSSSSEGQVTVEMIITDASGNQRTLSNHQSTDPLASYSFTGNANDNSSHTNHLTVHGATLSSDRFGMSDSAYRFDGNDDYLTGGDVNDLGTESVTFSAWFKTVVEVIHSDGHKILNKGLTSAGNNGGYAFRLYPGNVLGLDLNQGGNSGSYQVILKTSEPVNDGEWHHAVGVIDRDKSELRFYLDGISQGVADISNVGSLNAGGIPFTIGNLDRNTGTDGRSEHFNGLIDDVRIESEALSAATVMMRSNTVRLDRTLPTLTDVSIVSDNDHNPALAKVGDVIALTFEVSEEVDSLNAYINSSPAAITGSGTTWTARKTMDNHTDPEGQVTFSVNFSDQSGNQGVSVTSTTDNSSVRFDKTSPTAALSYSAPGPYRQGETVTITADYNESMLTTSTPRLKVILEDGTSVSEIMNWASGMDNRSSFDLLMRPGNGIAEVKLDDALDLAGNEVMPDPTEGGQFELDNIPPSAFISYQDGSGSPYPGPYRQGGDNVTLIVDFSEEMEATPTLNLVGATTNNDLPLTLDQTNPKRYRHTLSIPAGDGLVQVSLHGADPAGNQVQTVPTSGDNFTLDNTAPTGSLTFSGPGAQDGYTNTNSVNIQFTAQDAFGIAAYLTRLDNASVPEISDFIDTIAKEKDLCPIIKLINNWMIP